MLLKLGVPGFWTTTLQWSHDLKEKKKKRGEGEKKQSEGKYSPESSWYNFSKMFTKWDGSKTLFSLYWITVYCSNSILRNTINPELLSSF